MELRLIECYIPDGLEDELKNLLEPHEYLWISVDSLPGDPNLSLIRILTTVAWDEAVIDKLVNKFGVYKDFRIIVLKPETSVPLILKEKGEEALARLSRQELYHKLSDSAQFSVEFLLMLVLSTIVAAVGLLKNDPAALIGAMVMAPMLGPNMALALGSTLADLRLVKRALMTLFEGIVIAVLVAFVVGLILGVDPNVPAIASRTSVDVGSMLVAVSAGAAGAVSAVTGAMAALVGVMVAVALIPPLAAVGMLVAGGYWHLAIGAFLLFLANIIGINLASVVVFRLYGVAPSVWWEATRAKRATVISIGVWAVLLLLLVLIMVAM